MLYNDYFFFVHASCSCIYYQCCAMVLNLLFQRILSRCIIIDPVVIVHVDFYSCLILYSLGRFTA